MIKKQFTMANLQNDIETWVPIFGYEGLYEVSDKGRVRSLHRKRLRDGGIIKLQKHPQGYLRVAIYKDKKGKNRLIHRLVLTSFSDGPKIGLVINHKDGNKSNNNIENLEWVTLKQNTAHAINTKLSVNSFCGKGEKHGMAKLNEAQVREIKLLYPTILEKELAVKYSVTTETIYNILAGRTWKHVV